MSVCPSGVGDVNSISLMLWLGWCFGLSLVDDPAPGSLSALLSLVMLDEDAVADGLGKWWTMKEEFGEGEKEGEGEEFCWGEELLQAPSCLGSSLGFRSCVKDGDFGNWRNFCNCSCKICWNQISNVTSKVIKLKLFVLHMQYLTLYPKGLFILPIYLLKQISKLTIHSERTSLLWRIIDSWITSDICTEVVKELCFTVTAGPSSLFKTNLLTLPAALKPIQKTTHASNAAFGISYHCWLSCIVNSDTQTSWTN